MINGPVADRLSLLEPRLITELTVALVLIKQAQRSQRTEGLVEVGLREVEEGGGGHG
jgi:hypothetical protein